MRSANTEPHDLLKAVGRLTIAGCVTVDFDVLCGVDQRRDSRLPPFPLAREDMSCTKTGGLRTLPLMSSVLEHNRAHLLGIGRLSVVCPDLPLRLSESIAHRQAEEHDDFLMGPTPEPGVHGLRQPYPRPADASFASKCSAGLEWGLVALILYCGRHAPFEMPKLIGANAVVAWYNVILRWIAAGKEVEYTVYGRTWSCVAPNMVVDRASAGS